MPSYYYKCLLHSRSLLHTTRWCGPWYERWFVCRNMHPELIHFRPSWQLLLNNRFSLFALSVRRKWSTEESDCMSSFSIYRTFAPNNLTFWLVYPRFEILYTISLIIARCTACTAVFFKDYAYPVKRSINRIRSGISRDQPNSSFSPASLKLHYLR